MRRDLYLAAGLTAEGALKPRRVSARLYIDEVDSPNYRVRNGTWDGRTFVPARPAVEGEPKPEPKPEKVRCWIHDTHGRKYFHVGEPDHTPYVDGTDGSKCSIIPGTFIPD